MNNSEKRFSEAIVEDVYDLIVKGASSVRRGAKIREAIDEMILSPASRKVYVADDRGVLLGTVTTEAVLRLIGHRVGIRGLDTLSFYRFLREPLLRSVGEHLPTILFVLFPCTVKAALRVIRSGPMGQRRCICPDKYMPRSMK